MSGPGEISQAVESLVGLVSDLPPGTMLERLLANATDDPNPGVRLRNLRLLGDKFRSEEETKRAAEAVLADPEPAIRLLAATLVRGSQGLAVLKALIEEPGISDEVRRDAVRAAGASRDPSLLELLYALVPKRDPALAEAVATALGQLGKAEAETSLLRLMSRENTEVKRAAAAALGLLGTVRAVEPLLQLAAGPLGETARDAVRRIQARLGGDAQAGRLSVAAQDAAAGGLSIAAEGGELSVAEDDKAAEDPSPPSGRVKG
jgi:HEAT repeat protein